MNKENFFLWGDESKEYFDTVEAGVLEDWNNKIEPFCNIKHKGTAIDLACGHGRFTNIMKDKFESVYSVDVNDDNIKFCTERFEKNKNVFICKTNGFLLPFVDNFAEFIFSYDAMVHFDIDVIISYLRETKRVLKNGGTAFFHHSNSFNIKHTDIRKNPHWRNCMTRELFDFLARKEGLTVIRQQVIHWDEVSCSDCLTLLRKE